MQSIIASEVGYVVLSGAVIKTFRLYGPVGDLGVIQDILAEELTMVVPGIKLSQLDHALFLLIVALQDEDALRRVTTTRLMQF